MALVTSRHVWRCHVRLTYLRWAISPSPTPRKEASYTWLTSAYPRMFTRRSAQLKSFQAIFALAPLLRPCSYFCISFLFRYLSSPLFQIGYWVFLRHGPYETSLPHRLHANHSQCNSTKRQIHLFSKNCNNFWTKWDFFWSFEILMTLICVTYSVGVF